MDNSFQQLSYTPFGKPSSNQYITGKGPENRFNVQEMVK